MSHQCQCTLDRLINIGRGEFIAFTTGEIEQIADSLGGAVASLDDQTNHLQ